VDWNGGTLHVQRAISGGEFTASKTRKGRRRIYLSAGSIAALKKHRKYQLEERMARAGLWKGHGLVFPSNVGTPLSHRNVVRSFKAVLRRAGLPATIRRYDLRHTCATLLLCRNVHPKYVQELLGHASIAQTLDTYSHVLPGMNGGIGDAIDDALGLAPIAAPLLLQAPTRRSGPFPFPAICRSFRNEPPRTRTWNLEIKSLAGARCR
jgi:integrase